MDPKRKAFHLPRFTFQREYFLFLLPLFFVFHGYNENYGRIRVGEAILMLLQYELMLAVFALVFFLVFHSFRKAALFSFVLGCFYFFFGALHDWMKATVSGTVLVKYSFIIPVALILFTGIFISLRKKQLPWKGLVKYLNVLFLLLLGVEMGTFFFKKMPHQDIIKRATTYNPVKHLLKECDTCIKEDIHLIVLDEYAGETQLKEVFQFNNTAFLDTLRSRGFRVIKDAKSNYNYTHISMASMFSLNYLSGLDQFSHSDLVSVGTPIINQNIFVDFLVSQGYKINNTSIFDIRDHPAYVSEFTETGQLISMHTFPVRLYKDIGYHLISTLKSRTVLKKLMKKQVETARSNIDRIKDVTRSMLGNKEGGPHFYYTHLMMPHAPFGVDRNGRPFELSYFIDQNNEQGYKRGYLEYLQYCNKEVQSFVDTIIKSSKRPPIVILMSDHGFRHPTVKEKYHFMTLNAVYFPDRRYEGFYDGMSHVNQMRIVLNNRFYQQLPLLEDSCFFLNDR